MSQSATDLLTAIAAYKKEHGTNPSHKAVAALVEQVEAALGKQDTEPDETEDQTMPSPQDVKALRALAAKHLEPKPQTAAPKKQPAPAKTVKKAAPPSETQEMPSDWTSKSGSEAFKKKAAEYLAAKRQESEA